MRATRVPVVRPLAELGMRVLFDGIAPRWEQIRADPTYRDGLRAGFDALPEGFTPARVLDVACGTGIAAECALERWPGAEVHGFDISPRMIELAREHVPGATFEVASVRHMPAADGAVDLVVSLDGIVHPSEVARLLAPGGRVLVVYSRGGTTPIARPLDEVAAALAAVGLASEPHTGGPGHALVAWRAAGEGAS